MLSSTDVCCKEGADLCRTMDAETHGGDRRLRDHGDQVSDVKVPALDQEYMDLTYFSRYFHAPQLPGLASPEGEVIWELRGRVSFPKGILPVTLFPGLRLELYQGIFLPELYFTLTAESGLPGQSGDDWVYRADVTPTPMWPDWECYCPQKPANLSPREDTEATTERQPPIRSHARGLISRSEMDRIDGLQLPKSPVRPDVTLWRATPYTPHKILSAQQCPHTIMEMDCFEGLNKMIWTEAEKLSVVRIPGENQPCLLSIFSKTETDLKKEESVLSSRPTDISSSNEGFAKVVAKKKSLKKRLCGFLRRIKSCVRPKSN